MNAEPTVFIVDDDPSVRRSIERLVRSMGFAVQTFASAKEFTDHVRADGPSCLVLDVHLPDLSGLDLQRELTRSGVQIPIIFITGGGTIPNAGQVCVSVQRIFVHADIKAEFVDRLAKRVGMLRVGDPLSMDTGVGPLILPREADRVKSWVEEARALS